jgi:hypothetical protein
MISRTELLMWLATNDPEHVSAYCDLVADGSLTVEFDGDEIVGLTITAQGRAALGPTLPWGATA